MISVSNTAGLPDLHNLPYTTPWGPGREVRHASFDDVRASLVARFIGTHRDWKENSDGQVGRRMDI